MNTLFLQQTAMNPATMQILMIVLLVVIFYFFIIRPQTKKQKQLQKTREALKPGDKVITAGGIYGTIRDINSSTRVVTVEVWEGVKLKIDINSIYAANEAPEVEKK